MRDARNGRKSFLSLSFLIPSLSRDEGRTAPILHCGNYPTSLSYSAWVPIQNHSKPSETSTARAR